MWLLVPCLLRVSWAGKSWIALGIVLVGGSLVRLMFPHNPPHTTRQKDAALGAVFQCNRTPSVLPLLLFQCFFNISIIHPKWGCWALSEVPLLTTQVTVRLQCSHGVLHCVRVLQWWRAPPTQNGNCIQKSTTQNYAPRPKDSQCWGKPQHLVGAADTVAVGNALCLVRQNSSTTVWGKMSEVDVSAPNGSRE